MLKLNDEDLAVFSALPEQKAGEIVNLIDNWLDDQMSSVEPVVQGVLELVGVSEPETGDPVANVDYANKLLAMRTFIPSTGPNVFSRNPEGMLVQLVRIAQL